MSKKQIETPRKSPIFDGISTDDDAHAPWFNILYQTPPSKTDQISATGGPSPSKNQKDKNNEANQSVTTANQRGKKRKGKKLVETPLAVEISTILWHYRKTKNEDGAINESEVTGTIASKFGGPRIAKVHISDITNYPTPIPPTRKFKILPRGTGSNWVLDEILSKIPENPDEAARLEQLVMADACFSVISAILTAAPLTFWTAKEEGERSNDIFDMHSVDIDSKYYRQRYATILLHYRKIKNEDDAISKNEVTGTVARKFGGPHIANEYVSDTTNYPTPRPRTRNLR
ncbi:hypothetical protein H5410_034214 [Solanum commersonii]|uniref:Uncharacterized protein n=1 Tax=Solanum commersonii TaxID=4109 RepID=A0A9J5YUW9_SOLCO|nr:hypothetical protein H5410_034214 [Solanum commersonii]